MKLADLGYSPGPIVGDVRLEFLEELQLARTYLQLAWRGIFWNGACARGELCCSTPRGRNAISRWFVFNHRLWCYVNAYGFPTMCT